jgi:hypothetical protein
LHNYFKCKLAGEQRFDLVPEVGERSADPRVSSFRVLLGHPSTIFSKGEAAALMMSMV